DSHNRLKKIDAGIRGIEDQVCLSEQLQPVNESRVAHLFRNVTSPEVPVSNTAKQRILVISREHFAEVRFVGLEVADHSDDDRVPLGNFENPEVVFYPWAGLDLDRTNDPQWCCKCSVTRWQGWLHRHTRRTRPRCSLRPGGIEQVDVRVD